MRHSESLPERLTVDSSRVETGESADPAKRGYQESPELVQRYQQVRDAFLATQVAFQELERAHRQGRFDGPEHGEFSARAGDFRELVRLSRLRASAEIQRFADTQMASRSGAADLG